MPQREKMVAPGVKAREGIVHSRSSASLNGSRSKQQLSLPPDYELLVIRAMSSQDSLLSLETSHSCQPRLTSCDSLPASSHTLASIPSLYVTFKVLQLVNSFRNRVKTRVQSKASTKKDRSSKTTQDFCQDFERQAFEEIDRYLGRKAFSPYSKRKNTVPQRTATATAVQERPSKSVEWLLDQLNQAVKSETHALTTIANNDKLLVKRKEDFTFSKESPTLKELAALLVVVKDLLRTLRRTPHSRGAKTLCEGNEVLDFALDETYVANLEHLLLCLKDRLLRQLIARLVELVHKHVIECQRDQNKHSENWFFEFPDARHPLSTTWPWSIRPSLAVIWGVCWMFYDYHATQPPESDAPPLLDEYGNMLDEQGQVIADRHSVQQFFSNFQRHQESYNYTAHPNYMPQTPQQRPGSDPRVPRSAFDSPSSDRMAQPQPHHFSGLSGVATSHSHQAHPTNSESPNWFAWASPERIRTALLTPQAGATPAVPHGTATNNTYSAAPSAYNADSAPPAGPGNWLPEGIFDTAGLGAQANAYAADPWQQQLPPHSVPERFDFPEQSQTLPPRSSRGSLPPTIRVTTDLSQFAGFQQHPQDIYHSATSVSSNSSIPIQDSYYNPYGAHLSPQDTRYMPSDQQEMQTPPRSPHNVAVGEQLSRKRSHSVMSGGPQPLSAGSRSGSAPLESGDDFTPHRAQKRADPPMNAENKYVCDFSSDCSSLTFERKCEWSKHMDKHDRPYRCPHPQCAKLQGFTYSGGLLRHEREVHGKHGGPKAQLVCPHPDCKRHSGKGFTRKENLNEHIRRVHQSRDSQMQNTSLKRDATDAIQGADDGETPASEPIEGEDMASPALKRRRYMPPSDRSASEDVEDLKHELKRLRNENQQKDQQMQQMQDDMRQMQEMMRQFQQQQQPPQGQGQG